MKFTALALPSRRLVLWTCFVVLLVFLAWLLSRYVSPAPPRHLSMTTGAADGAYHQFALKYQTILKDNGITLSLQTSTGSMENLKRLESGSVEVGLVQGGLGVLAQNPQTDPDDVSLRSLATVAYEPVWVFTRQIDLSGGLAPLAGRKVAVGVAGSGNEKVALELLGVYGLVDGAGNALQNTALVHEGGLSAASRLQAGELDAVIMVAAVQAPAVVRMLQDEKLHLASLNHADGIARRAPYFQVVTLKAGSVDPRRNLPARDIALLATTANLVISNSLHPALAFLLLEAAHQTHRKPSLLNRAGEFPSPQATDFPLAEESERYFKNGRPFLQRYLPFWLAELVQRLVLMLVPIIAVLVPVLKVLPWVLNWRRQARLFRRYGELKFLEQDVVSHKLSAEEMAWASRQLDRIERDIMTGRFPLDYSDRVYTLRQHVDYVRSKIQSAGLTPP